MNKISSIGKMALGSRLRLLSSTLTEDAKSVYALYDIPLKPKWFPVFYTLSEDGSLPISKIAVEIGHSHPSVIKIVKEMKEAGIVSTKRDIHDARKTNVLLTKEGKTIVKKIEPQYKDVHEAIDKLLRNNDHDLLKALDEVEYLLNQKSFYRRVLEQKKEREAQLIEIVDYQPKYRAVFKDLNQEWIETYFEMEEADHKALDHPEKYIINKGGFILIALCDKKPAGVCALMKMEHEQYEFELAKMAVSPKFQGKGIGYVLGNAVIEKAKKENAKAIFLESNTKLKPAINLYHKLGFKRVTGMSTPYARSNIQMELILN